MVTMQEPEGGMSEKVYKTLAVQKTKEGIEIYTYFDKYCLNYGQNWEKGFIHGLTNSKLIALLVSNKVLMFLKTLSIHFS
jgi:hypothetical protein